MTTWRGFRLPMDVMEVRPGGTDAGSGSTGLAAAIAGVDLLVDTAGSEGGSHCVSSVMMFQ